MRFQTNIGAVYLGGGRCRFRVWAPFKEKVEIRIVSPRDRMIPMEREERGYWSVEADGVEPGARYMIRLDGKVERPDPASFYQPESVHGPSEVIALDFEWRDEGWSGPPLRDYIFYEVHVGTFTPDGSFAGVESKLEYLVDLGITSVEIMPVAQFPGGRNWGYDGVFPFAVQNTYGGPAGFQRLVDACHKEGLSVTLDVVYNHFGPEGNYTREFGPYFTDKYLTPWGGALNFDDRYNDEARNFFIQNALFWFNIYHVDALRLDAVHAIYDRSANPFLAQLAERVDEFVKSTGKRVYLIAESDLNDSRLVRPKRVWGYGLDAQWSDDFHHSLHVLLTGEKAGYYLDFGRVSDLVTSFEEGYVYSGKYSRVRKKSHGNYSADLPSENFVIAAQNHDQVGNRMFGERLSSLVSFEGRKVAAAVVLLSPFVPLIFMGEEYGEEAPFLYFVSHSDPQLVEAVRKGRKEEFKDFTWEEEPPYPDSEETFRKSRLDWRKINWENHGALLRFYKKLIRIRRDDPVLSDGDRTGMRSAAFEGRKLMLLQRQSGREVRLLLFNFSPDKQTLSQGECAPGGTFVKVLDSTDSEWGGPGSSLPEMLDGSKSLEMSGLSVAMYSKTI